MNEFCVGKPKIFDEDVFIWRVKDILNKGIFSNNGPYCKDLEDLLSKFIGVDHTIVFSNATLALEAVFSFIKSKMIYGQVLVPSFTFIASVNSIVRAGLEPLFVDIENDYSMSFADSVFKHNSSTVAALPCNLFGNLCQRSIEELVPYTVYDSAHALNIFSQTYSKMAGSFGFCEVFSFHPTKILGGMEGGCVTTNSDELNTYLRRWRNFGFETGSKNPQGELSTVIGTNAKASEIACAAALTQLEDYECIQSHYFENFKHYTNYLPSWIELVKPNQEFSNFSYIVCRTTYRDHLLEYLFNHGIHARSYFQPVHRSAPYIQRYGHYRLPVTESLADETFCLPTGLNISEKDIAKICNIITRWRTK